MKNPRDTILQRWRITAEELTELVDGNPSLRGIMLGYVAEMKLRQIWFSGSGIEYLSKHDDHDRARKGDHIVKYKRKTLIVEAKSLRTSTIRREGKVWRGKAQVDASDCRRISLPDGTSLTTTLLLVGGFDLLAVNCFAFEGKWRFAFAKNSDLPRSTYHKYPEKVRKHLLASLVSVTWPPEPPFHDNPYAPLDEIVAERTGRVP